MYSYIFEFYRPGKEFYTQEEMFGLNSAFLRAGFEAKTNWTAGDKVRRADFSLSNGKTELSLVLGPADDRFNEMIGQFSVTEEQLKRDLLKNTEAFAGLAEVISVNLNSLFAWGDHELEIRKLEPFLRFDHISALAWHNIFSRELVERFGGIRNVLIVPTVEAENQGNQILKEVSFLPISLSEFPTETVAADVAVNCLHHFPGAILKGFEIFPSGAVTRSRR